MCGIFGALGFDDIAQLEKCAQQLHHRGPDGFGTYFDPQNKVFLGHNRLSILDLSENGKQPMCNESGDIWLVFNGEIYNFRELRAQLLEKGHVFRSNTDSEVIIHAYEEWGHGCVERLFGMFAFGIWDVGRRRLFLARDRLGIKPLYIWRRNGHFAFASEPKALLGLEGFRKQITLEALAGYLMYGYVPGKLSIWQDVERLSPGHFFSLDLRTGQEDKLAYWRLPFRNSHYDTVEATEQLAHLLDTIVPQHLISDVPLGVLLSGGLDSSNVAASAARNHRGIEAFTVGFEDSPSSETAQAADIAAYLGIAHHVQITSAADFRNIEKTFEVFDEPHSDSSIFSNDAVCRLVRRHVKVAITGDGGDELFGGYQWYIQLEKRPWRRNLAFMAESIRRRFGIGRPFPHGCGDRFEYLRLLRSPSFDVDELARLIPSLSVDLIREVVKQNTVDRFDERAGQFKRWQLLDLETFLVDNNLVYMDRVSMAHGLEMRVPLLDHRLVEFAYSLPDHLCIDHGRTKVLLRSLAEIRLPKSVANKTKQGFSSPTSQLWPMEDMVELITSGVLIREGILDKRQFGELLQSSGRGQYPVYLLAVLELWAKRWLVDSDGAVSSSANTAVQHAPDSKFVASRAQSLATKEKRMDLRRKEGKPSSPRKLSNDLRKLKQTAGVSLLDVPRMLQALAEKSKKPFHPAWVNICNRNEQLIFDPNGPGVKCNWQWSSELVACRLFPKLGRKLLQRVLQDWPIAFVSEFPNKPTPRISVLIPHRGSERLALLDATLRSWCAQIDASIECIVIEQAESPSIGELPPGTRYIHVPLADEEEPFRKSHCYNLGFYEAKGDLIVCHDGDIVVPQGYARELVRRFEDSDLEVLFPQRFLFYFDPQNTRKILEWDAIVPELIPSEVKANWRGGTLAIRRQAFSRIGGFDEGFIGWSGEDIEFYDRCLTLNCNVFGYIPFMHLWHPPQPSKFGAERDAHVAFTRSLMSIPRADRVETLRRKKNLWVPSCTSPSGRGREISSG